MLRLNDCNPQQNKFEPIMNTSIDIKYIRRKHKFCQQGSTEGHDIDPNDNAIIVCCFDKNIVGQNPTETIFKFSHLFPQYIYCGGMPFNVILWVAVMGVGLDQSENAPCSAVNVSKFPTNSSNCSILLCPATARMPSESSGDSLNTSGTVFVTILNY